MSALGNWAGPPAGLPPALIPGLAPGGVLADISELIVAVHARVRSLFTVLGYAAEAGRSTWAPSALVPVWAGIAGLLTLNADAEEEICFPAVLVPARRGSRRSSTPSPTTTTSATRSVTLGCGKPGQAPGGVRCARCAGRAVITSRDRKAAP
jgi:hypothetical protein